MELSIHQHKQLQQNLLYIMDEIHRICIKHNIKYSLFYGSLIGAVVHRGFIPWDDDIDLAMSKNEYRRFKEACLRELGSDFFFQTPETEAEYLVPLQTKIRLNNTLLLEEIDAFRNIHHGVSVDIVCFEDIDDNFSNLKKTKFYFSLFKDKYYYHVGKRHYSLKGLIYHSMRRALPPFTIRRTARAFVKCASQYHNSESEFVFFPFSYQDDVYRREWVNEYRLYAFEGRQFMGFARYDEILKVRYPSYMIIPPVSERRTNHQYCKVRLLDMPERR